MEKQFDKTRALAIFYLVAASLLWSLGGVFIKWVQWNPIAIAGMRSSVSAVFIWIVLRKPRFNWSRDQILCAFCYAATVILFVVANKLTTAANVILLQYTAPIYVAIFGFFVLKEKTTKLDWLTVTVVVGGMVLFFIDDIDVTGLWGNMLATLSGITFAGVVMLMRKQKDGSPLESVLMGNILTAIIASPFMLTSAPSVTTSLTLIMMGIIQLGLPYVLYSIAIKSVTALEAVLIPVIEPIANPIWVFFMLGEVPGKWAVVGGIVVIAAVTLRCVFIALKPPAATDIECEKR